MEIDEIAKDVFRISTFIPNIDMQINRFLVADDEPLLWHTGLKEQFPNVQKAVAEVLDPSTIRWIGFSHFEADECGALNEWLKLARKAQTICSEVGAAVNVNDFAIRPPQGLTSEDVITTGRYRFRFYPTPHLPHGWDAGMLFEESGRILFCSDLFHQNGNPEPVITSKSELMERTHEVLTELQNTPFRNYMPLTLNTEQMLHHLAALKPKTLAIMHGSSFSGDGEHAIKDLAMVMKETLRNPSDG